MNRPQKNSMEYEMLQKIAKIMTANSKILLERAKNNGVTLKELLDYLDTPEGYNSAVRLSSQIYTVGTNNNIFSPLY